jgi:A/G-specific adenine glycosylase
VRASLLAWYATDHRDFPWRRTTDPYAVLVSEVMLQQTQASRVAERFPTFMSRFPTTRALAEASDAEVLAAWSGLGYNRRALALQRAAAAVSTNGWPSDVAALERLPGIGPYTARAVASLAFGEPVGVVDTNVRRWPAASAFRPGPASASFRRWRMPSPRPATPPTPLPGPTPRWSSGQPSAPHETRAATPAPSPRAARHEGSQPQSPSRARRPSPVPTGRIAERCCEH